MNYFQFYRMPMRFIIDDDELNRKFFEYTKLYRPDFYSLRTPDENMKKLEYSELNNKAFKTIKNFDSRIRYILEVKEILSGNADIAVPETYKTLLEGLEENIRSGKEPKDVLESKIQTLEEEGRAAVENILQTPVEDCQTEDLQRIKDYYFLRQHLLRIRRMLDNFAT